MASLSFHGAAGTVTGSRFLLEAAGRSLLVDCGLFQGLKELRQRNWDAPRFDVQRVGAVVLTHAHIDHAGALPRLGMLGYRGPIWCTPATHDLSDLLLRDSAHIQEEDAEYANQKGWTKHQPALPLYTVEAAEKVLRLFRRVGYGAWFEPIAGEQRIRARLHHAGHILGSATVELEIADRSPPLRLLFSGDVGRYDAPLVPDPEPPVACDVLVCESTYGDRVHPKEGASAQLAAILKRVAASRGTMLVPAFAVGRAQQLIYLLRRLMDAGQAPEMAIHLDSPMAVDATEVYRRYPEEHGLEEVALTSCGQPIFRNGVYLHCSRDESMRLNHLEGPRVILSSSGMLAGGRVLHHLRRLLPDSRNVVVLAGYQAEGTRGRALLEGARYLRMHGEDVPVRAGVVEVPGMSGHADADELVRWLKDLPVKPKTTFVVHGEPAAAATLAQRFERELALHCRVPAHLEKVEL